MYTNVKQSTNKWGAAFRNDPVAKMSYRLESIWSCPPEETKKKQRGVII